MKKGLSVIIIIFLLFAVAVMGWYIMTEEEKEDNLTSNKSYLLTTFKDDDIKTIGKVIKEYSYDNNLADKDNITKWEFESIKYLGYFNEEKELLYYEVHGGFVCKEDNFDCVYVSQAGEMGDEMYKYHVYVVLKKNNEKYSLVSIEPVLESTNQLVTEKLGGYKNTGYTYNELITLYKEYIISHGLALNPDIKEWNVELIYLGKDNEDLVFNVKTKYSCLSETHYCIYQAQVGENPYEYETYATMDKGKDGKYKFVTIAILYDDGIKVSALKEDIENKVVTRDGIAEQLKEYYYANELATKDNVKTFDISYVTYKGELKGKPGNYVIRATVSYDCLDGMRTCVYSDVTKDPGSGLYTFSVEFYLTANKDGNYDITYVGNSVNDDHINVDSVVLQ